MPTGTGAVAFPGVPGIAFRGDLTFLQFAFDYILTRVVAAVWPWPAYFRRGAPFTADLVLAVRPGGAT